MGTMKKAIFLDSDGVLNLALLEDGKPVAPARLSEFIIPTEVKPALNRLKSSDYLLICVTNKPDVERGRMTQATVDGICSKMRAELPLDDIFICYTEHSDCYKPKPGLLLEAAQKYHIDLTNSYMIGDRWRDVEAGKSAGCKTVWIDHGYPNDKLPSPAADCTVHSLNDAAEWILSDAKKTTTTLI
jgi:D-glycero-D-manno-heptose 1,7-bisphosphate phosphatase